MTNIEQKALELVNEVSDGFHDVTSIYEIHTAKALRSALCRAIERHEAFRREVSDVAAATAAVGSPWVKECLARFIIAKPDPLEMAREEAEKRAVDVAATHEGPTDNEVRLMQDAAYFAVREFEKSIVKHGFEIREKANGGKGAKGA